MDLIDGVAAESFRGAVSPFLTGAWQPGERRGPDLAEFVKHFLLAAIKRGYLYRSVPRRFGGSEQPVDVIRAQVSRSESSKGSSTSWPTWLSMRNRPGH